MKIQKYFTLFVLIIITNLAHGMVGGRGLSSKEKEELRSVFGLRLRGILPGSGEAIIKGMASHIGNGWLLTAHHVPNSMNPASIQVLDIQGRAIGSPSTKFVTLKPETENEIKVSNMTVLLPDIAIVEMPDAIRDEIEKYPIMPLKGESAFPKKITPLAIGWGSETFEPGQMGDKDEFKIGPIQIFEEIDLLGLKSFWQPKSKFAAVRPGDSGGPLIAKDSEGRFVQIAVSSLAGTTRNSWGQVTNAYGYFSPLNKPSVYNWLKKTIPSP